MKKPEKIYSCGNCNIARINLTVSFNNNIATFRITNTGTMNLCGEFMICSKIIEQINICGDFLTEGSFIEITKPYIIPESSEINNFNILSTIIAYSKVKDDIWIYDEIKEIIPVLGTYLNTYSEFHFDNNDLWVQVLCGNAEFPNIVSAINLKCEIKLPQSLAGSSITAQTSLNCTMIISGESVIITSPILSPGQTCGAFFFITPPSSFPGNNVINIAGIFTSNIINLSGNLNRFSLQ